VILRREFVFFNKGDAAFILMKGRRFMNAALDSIRMQTSGRNGDAILGSSGLTCGFQLVDGDATLAQQRRGSGPLRGRKLDKGDTTLRFMKGCGFQGAAFGIL